MPVMDHPEERLMPPVDDRERPHGSDDLVVNQNGERALVLGGVRVPELAVVVVQEIHLENCTEGVGARRRSRIPRRSSFYLESQTQAAAMAPWVAEVEMESDVSLWYTSVYCSSTMLPR
jgi:hypothetical protein